MKGKWLLVSLFLIAAYIEVKGQKVVRCDLTIRDTTVNFTGKSRRAIAVNGQIPMPTLTFTEGDTAEIYVHNELNEETSLHWHGLFLPNRYDGVPNLTQMPIKPGTTHLYKFPIIQHGTHWYHSHTGMQEQIGMYGSFIMNKKAEFDIPTLPVVLSEWTDYNPDNVHRMLHNASDWFAIKKNATQSYAEAIREQHTQRWATGELMSPQEEDKQSAWAQILLELEDLRFDHIAKFYGIALPPNPNQESEENDEPQTEAGDD